MVNGKLRLRAARRKQKPGDTRQAEEDAGPLKPGDVLDAPSGQDHCRPERHCRHQQCRDEDRGMCQPDNVAELVEAIARKTREDKQRDVAAGDLPGAAATDPTPDQHSGGDEAEQHKRWPLPTGGSIPVGSCLSPVLPAEAKICTGSIWTTRAETGNTGRGSAQGDIGNQTGEQCGARNDGVELDIFMRAVIQATDRAKAVQRWDAERGSEVAI